MKIYAILLSFILVIASGGYIYILKKDIKNLESDLSVCESKIPATEFKATWETKFNDFNVAVEEQKPSAPTKHIHKNIKEGYFEEIIK